MLINLSSQIGIFVMNTCGGNPQKIRSPLFASVSMFATWHVQVESPSLHALLVPTPHHRPLVTVRWGKWLIHRLFIPPLWLTFARPRMRRAHSVQSLAHYWMFVLSFSPHSLADNPVSSYGSQSHDLGLPKPKMILGCAGRELTVHSTRILSARPAEMFLPTVLTADALASGASSMASSNWRSSTSTMSSTRTSPEMQGGDLQRQRWDPHPEDDTLITLASVTQSSASLARLPWCCHIDLSAPGCPQRLRRVATAPARSCPHGS